jgi:hypothetical protein
MRRATLLPVLLALLLTPVAAVAQDECNLDQSRHVAVHNRGTPYEMAYLGGPVLACPNGVRITADSAIFSAPTSQVQFLGRVRFSDEARRLDADYAQYMIESRHLAAQGNVLLLDHANGSTIRSPTLDYLMASPERPEARIEVYRGRPRTTLMPAGGAPDTTIVDADALSIVGDRTFIGRGNVVLRRGELNGRGGELEYDQESGSLRLDGSARLATAAYTLDGQTIVATMDGDTIREVTADGEGMLVAENLDVEAPHIRVYFAAGEVDRLVAFRPVIGNGPESSAGANDIATLPQARVRSPEFHMIGDSIDVHSPQQRLERVFAAGGAFAERIPTDSLEIAAAEALPEMVRRDWVRGDTIVATFITAPPADTAALPTTVAVAAEAGSAAQPEQVLESLTVSGGATPASSAYRSRDENEAPGGRLTVNYVIARHIVVSFVDGSVRRVEAEGDVSGVHIRPTAQTAVIPEPGPVPP